MPEDLDETQIEGCYRAVAKYLNCGSDDSAFVEGMTKGLEGCAGVGRASVVVTLDWILNVAMVSFLAVRPCLNDVGERKLSANILRDRVW